MDRVSTDPRILKKHEEIKKEIQIIELRHKSN
jgi:hypothetical protein